MSDNNNADAMRVIGVLKENGWKEGDIASLADYLDNRSRALIREEMRPLADRLKWIAVGLAVLILIEPSELTKMALRFLFG